MPLSVIIPAAGVGRGMREAGPKCLFPLGTKKTILSHQIDTIRGVFDDPEIIVVVGFQSDLVMSSLPGVKWVENENFEHTNTLRSVGMGLRVASHENVMVSYGDMVYKRDSLAGIDREVSSALFDHAGGILETAIGGAISQDRVTNFGYGLTTKWAQVALLKGKELKLFRDMAFSKQSRRIMVHEALNFVIDHGGTIKPIYNRGPIQIIDTLKSLERARIIAK